MTEYLYSQVLTIPYMGTSCRKNNNKEFVCGYNITTSGNKNQLNRIVLYHYFRDVPLPHKSFFRRALIVGTRLLLSLTGIRKKPYITVDGKRWDIYFGSQWVSMTRKCAEYVLEQLEKNTTLCKYFSTAYAPDELVVPTIVFNSKFSSQAILCQKLDFSILTPLHYLHYTSHIWTYDETDFDDIIKSGKMFVRKLISPKSDKLVEMLEQYKKGK